MATQLSLAEATAQASALAPDPRPFIDGRRVDAAAADRFAVAFRGGAGGSVELADCGQADVDAAVAAARRAFDASGWRDLAAGERGAMLIRLADAVAAEAVPLALLDSAQMGMPLAQAVAFIQDSADTLRMIGSLADAVCDQVVPSRAGSMVVQARRPQGVVAAITPWNFPVHVALAKAAPALAMGYSVVLKPSEAAPLACLRLADLALAAGVPAGVLNALPGTGPTTGRLLALHPDVDCLAFVGSTATGLQLLQYSGQSNMKKLLLECGGKSPQIVFDDMGDPETLADALVQGFTWNSGQVCVSGSRLLVADSLADRLLPLLARKVAALATGDPFDPATRLGPLANAAQFRRVRGFLDRAAASDRLIAAGTVSGAQPNEVAPHLYVAEDPSTTLMQEEIFGPVAAVLRFRDEAEAVRLANATRYGLSATIWSRDLAQAQRVAAQVRAGFVFANAIARPGASGSRHVAGEPFGMSGFGVDGGIEGMLGYTRLQAVMAAFA